MHAAALPPLAAQDRFQSRGRPGAKRFMLQARVQHLHQSSSLVDSRTAQRGKSWPMNSVVPVRLGSVRFKRAGVNWTVVPRRFGSLRFGFVRDGLKRSN